MGNIPSTPIVEEVVMKGSIGNNGSGLLESLPIWLFSGPWGQASVIAPIFFGFLTNLTNQILASNFIITLTMDVSKFLTLNNIPEPHPKPDQILLCLVVPICTLFMYFVIFGKRHRLKRKELQDELIMALEKVQELEDQIVEDDENELNSRLKRRRGKPIRIWMDGAFDMMHYGHMNAFRQGKSLGTHLVVGVNSDETITQCKGKPLMNDMERSTAVMGCKFVDEIVTECPYVMSAEYLNYVMEKYQIDYVVHGDDPCIVDGKDVYELPKKMGKYKSIPRTEGVSTTDIVGRMLLMTSSHHDTALGNNSGDMKSSGQLASGKEAKEKNDTHIYTRSRFLTTSRMIRLFSAGMKLPERGQRIVYIDGAWDMFHAGHIKTLERAKAMGDFLIVGVHNDLTVNKRRGSNRPIMNLHERTLSVLGCKYVDDVLIDAPWIIEKEMMASLKISLVVCGTKQDDKYYYDSSSSDDDKSNSEVNSIDPYAIPKSMDKFKQITSEIDLSVVEIQRRITENQAIYEKKFAKKKKQEDAYYDDKYKGYDDNKDKKSKNSNNVRKRK